LFFGGWGGELGGGLMEREIQNGHRHALDAFQSWAVKAPDVQSHVTGDMDYVLQLAVRDLDEYNNFINRMLPKHQGFVRTNKSLIALKVVKLVNLKLFVKSNI
jgi:DNA-binding Lrp family transcriptional regulator